MSKLILIAALLFAPSTTYAQPSLAPNNTVKLDSLLHTIYADTLPGASVVVLQNNKVIFEKSYGVSNMNSKAPITSTTNFNIASLTKQFTAMAILQLAARGKLSLDNNLSRFFTDMNKGVGNAFTVRHLLTHSSGIIDHYDFTNTQHLKHAHNADVYAAIKNVDSLYFSPGMQFRYSNTGFCLLALIIEKVSGISYNSYMQQFIFRPARMAHTVVWNENETIDHPATGYEWDSMQHRFITSGPNEHIFFSTEGDGGIYTSVHDYTLWLRALQEGKVFSKQIVAKAQSIQHYIAKEKGLGYGFGWFIDSSGTVKNVYHSGSNGGFRSYSFNIPEQHYSIVIFSNRTNVDVEDLAQKINQLLHPNSKPFTLIEILTS